LLENGYIKKNELIKDKSKATPKYILDTLLMMQLNGEKNAFKDKEILDQCLLFFTAGQDTTAYLLLMTIYLFSQHP